MVGGVPRLRLSSQSIKRGTGERTKRIARELEAHLTEQGADTKEARKAATALASIFSKLEAAKEGAAPLTTTLAFVSPEE